MLPVFIPGTGVSQLTTVHCTNMSYLKKELTKLTNNYDYFTNSYTESVYIDV
jgi:hypothetical protein